MDVPLVGRDTPNENEQRVLGGFLSESPYSDDAIDLLQTEVPVGCQRVADAFDDVIDIDRSISTVLAPRTYTGLPEGFLNEKELSQQFGSRMASYTAKADAVAVTDEVVWVIEIKTRSQCIEGMHDAYEGFGQILMNRDRFKEDYPTVGQERNIRGLLLAEGSEVDIELLEESLEQRGISFFDPLRGGFLISA
jgi:hypothetical protein